MKKTTTALVLIALFIFSGIKLSQAQQAEIEGIRKKEFRGVFAIQNKQTEKVEGYYTFYVNEKAGKGMVNFIIAIFDIDMKMVKQTPITISKRSIVAGSEFNGKDFMFVFNDIVKKKLTYVTVDKQGNIIKTKGIIEKKRYAATAEVYPAPDGFYIVKPIKEKKWGWSIEKVDNQLKEIWEKRFMVEKGFVAVEAVKAAGNKVIIIQRTQAKVLSKKAKGEIVCLNAVTGNEEYKYPLYDGESTGIPSAFTIDKDQNVVTGGMYFKGEKWASNNSDGIFFLKIGPDGKKMSYEKEDWDEGIQNIIKKGTKKSFSISSKPKVIFHQIVQGGDGGYQVIGETFKKSYQVVSLKLKDAISGRFIGDINESKENGNKPWTFEVMDFIVFNYDGDGEMSEINIIEKEHTKISCYKPYNHMGGLKLALYVKKFGWFNYAFTTKVPGSDQDYLISAMFVKSPYIGITSIEAGEKSVTHQIPITKRTIKGGGIGVMPSKPGYLGVYIFSKKEKTVLIYLEEIKM